VVDGVRFFDVGEPLSANLLIVLMLASVLLCSAWTYRYIELTGQRIGKRLMRADARPGALQQKATTQAGTA
jgi:peptidoglycan/LPS O-acetylase OafA/YrhL